MNVDNQQVEDQEQDERKQQRLKWVLKQVEQWDVEAQGGSKRHMLWLGRLFMFGHVDFPEVKIDEKRGFLWYSRLAETEDPTALYRIGMVYSKGCEGLHIKPDGNMALKYLKHSHLVGQQHAAFSIAHIYSHGRDDVEADLQSAAHWYRISVEAGGIPARANLGEMYLYGRGVEQNFEEAFRLNSEAARGTNAPGIGNTGFCYEKGYGVEKDLVKAQHFYSLGASEGSQHSAMNLALLLYRNLISMDPDTMATKYKKPLPHTAKGWLSYAMKDVTQSDYYKYQLAFVNDVNYQKRLSEQGDVDALVFLGFLYTYGLLHNQQNISRALAYYNGAAAKQDHFALEMKTLITDLQDAMASDQTDMEFVGEVLNIIVGYMFDIDLHYDPKPKPEQTDFDLYEDDVDMQ